MRPADPVALGTAAPPFRLPIANPDVDGRESATRSLDDFADAEALVVVFWCNHCPYVHAVEDRVVALARAFAPRVQVVAVCSNDAERYPQDGFEAMRERAAAKGYPFPYLRDEDQAVARAYGAVCTPEFFAFDRARGLVYRGRLDDGRPGREPTQHDLRVALEQLLETGAVSRLSWPAMGCSIKWGEPT